MDNVDLNKEYSSLKMDYTTVIKLKTLAKQRGIKGYYKLRKADLIQKLVVHLDVNEQVLIPRLEISRDRTGSVSTSAIVDDPHFWMIKLQSYNQHQILLLKAYKNQRFWRMVVELHSTKTKSD